MIDWSIVVSLFVFLGIVIAILLILTVISMFFVIHGISGRGPISILTGDYFFERKMKKKREKQIREFSE